MVSVAVRVSREDVAVPAAAPSDVDAMLIERIAAGDEAAFRKLLERYVDRAFALALRFLRNSTDAEDVVQDVMLKIWSNGSAWKPGAARFSTWLYRVITNRCLDLCRRPKGVDFEQVPEMIDTQPDAVSLVHNGQLNGLLENAMAGLPEQQRVALILSYHDDLSNGEIAQILETTVQAVESLLKRGRQQLRKRLATYEGEIRESFRKD